MRIILAAASISVLAISCANAASSRFLHANHIFNEIHSSARQFGSSLNHNGMAFFIATIPEGTELYHGTGKNMPASGMSWMAFEPEHSLIFARPGSNGLQSHKRDDVQVESLPPRESGSAQSRDKSSKSDQKKQSNNLLEDHTYGYLHTYRTKKELRLLYLDGASAANSNKGTLDLQDFILLRNNPMDHSRMRNGGEYEEDSARASKMCEIVREEWNRDISGILRMEGGFEIILCDCENDLDVVRISRAKLYDGPAGMVLDSPGYYKAIAARYHGIGGGRIALNYDDYISLFAYPEAIYFDDSNRPRVDNTSATLDEIREAVSLMVARASKGPAGRTADWQAIVDMVVMRYADSIDYLASENARTLQDFKIEAERALRPFIDYGSRDTTAEIERCSKHFVPWNQRSSNTTAARAIHEVNRVICETFSLLFHPTTKTLAGAFSVTRSLKRYLSWTEWRKCKGCNSDETCFIPVWPLGSKEDFERPRCVKDIRKVGRDYWGRDVRQSRIRNEALKIKDEMIADRSAGDLCHVTSAYSLQEVLSTGSRLETCEAGGRMPLD